MAERSEFERDLEVLAEQLRRLEAEYTMYFSGRLPSPPHQMRAKVEALVRRYDRAHMGNYAERFRFSTLQARYVRLVDLWERALRAREEGRPGPFSMPRGAGAPPSTSDGTVMHVTQLADPERQADRLRGLYDTIARARRETGERPIPFEQFATLIAQQVKRLGVSSSDEVTFEVALKDGKVRLTARASRRERLP